MQIRYGYRIEIVCDRPTTLVTMLDIHPSRRHDLLEPDEMRVTALLDTGASLPVERHFDSFGNICRRMVVPAGGVRLEASGLIYDCGRPDVTAPDARQLSPAEIPAELMGFLLGSRYCETDKLMDTAWSLFGHLQPGWGRVQAIVDFVHNHLTFGYAFARSTRTAAEAYEERIGVCRDFAHLAVAFCRCLNIPARYCNGYLGDIGVPPNPAPMDFNAWCEVWLDGRWYTIDARHHQPRIGRVVIARGRDATDLPMLNSFGSHVLQRFEVVTEEVGAGARQISASPASPRLVPGDRGGHIAA
ncbi:MAG: transglutaminase family protein [Bosea sp.]|uniref:transglutaminase-like domain-containing protein n=1 Tax=Bosea sp. (in: a-proteobacteria) TaxID=1871050 RepID=UPI001AC594A4|nr:transglutaminase family protein [Bosea sp. (in: a-proteobacteria)]MBN9467449.1 transglutaminase family protein [Bosea sp. (in: a-proteobacteria)]